MLHSQRPDLVPTQETEIAFEDLMAAITAHVHFRFAEEAVEQEAAVKKSKEARIVRPGF